MKIGLVMALEEEAAPIINALGLTKTSDRTYEGKAGDNDVCLRLAWMGQVNAQNAAWQLIGEGVQALVNVGTCGDLGDHGIGACVFPNVFYIGDFDLSPIGFDTKDPANVNEGLSGEKDGNTLAQREICYSFSSFVTDERTKGAIVEMEAYSIAAVAACAGVPFLAAKCCSDGANDDASENFDSNVSSVVQKNADTIVRALKEFETVHAEIFKRK